MKKAAMVKWAGLILWLALLQASSMLAQINTATLLGTVKDKSGAVIPGATVTVKNLGTGSTRMVATDSSGDYTLTNLQVGHYSITATFKGFQTKTIPDLELQVAQKAQIDITLAVGAPTQTITVTTQSPLLASTTSSVGQVVDTQAVIQMPLNGRQFWQLVQLTPGASYLPTGQNTRTGGSSIRSSVVNVNINGTGRIFNGWSLDGVDITEYEQGGTMVSPNVDALQEFKVESSNMSAEYGHTPNRVNATLKSGSNQFHGDAFEFVRNDVFDAANFFFVPTPGTNQNKEILQRNQYGGTVGGPIKHDRTFFFADYQGTGLRQGIDFSSVVPSIAERGGDFSNLLSGPKPTILKNPLTGKALSGNVIPTGMISPQASFFLPYMPTPNFIQGTTSRAVFANKLSVDTRQGDLKIDEQATPNDHFMGSYSIVDNAEQDPNPFPKLGAFPLHDRAQAFGLTWTHIFGAHWINEARFGYYRDIFEFGQALAGTNFDQEAGIQGFSQTNIDPSFPLITISGYAEFEGSGFDNRPKSNRIRTWQYEDSVEYASGKHDLKTGFEWYHQTHGFIIGEGSEGKFAFTPEYTGNAFGDYLLGYPNNIFRGDFLNLFGNYGNFIASFIQDNYRVRQDLTLNVGLRWEIDPFFYGIEGQTSGFDFATGQIVIPSNLNLSAQPESQALLAVFKDRIVSSSGLGLPDSIRPTQWSNFNPRVGFAWRPFNSNNWVVRGAYGIFTIFPDSNMTLQAIHAPPLSDGQTVFNNPLPGTPLPWSNFFQGVPLGAPNPNPGQPCPFGKALLSCEEPNIDSMPLHLNQTYTGEWNLAIQREITNRLSLDVAYVGNKTTFLQEFVSANDPLPGGGSIQSRRPYPQWGTMSIPSWNGNGNYNALQVKLEVRGWHGLSMLGSYSWSHCFDWGSNEATVTTILEPNYGPCDFDQPQNFVLSNVYDLPFGPGRAFFTNIHGWQRQLLGGWEINGITTLQPGLPFTPTVNGDLANTGVGSQRPDEIGVPMVLGSVNCWYYTASNPACRALLPGGQNAFADPPMLLRYGNSGRNILRADGLFQLDFSLLKVFPVSETKSFEFRAEFFNLTNTPTFSAPVRTVDISSGGQVSSTLNSARIIQFGIKFHF